MAAVKPEDAALTRVLLGEPSPFTQNWCFCFGECGEPTIFFPLIQCRVELFLFFQPQNCYVYFYLPLVFILHYYVFGVWVAEEDASLNNLLFGSGRFGVGAIGPVGAIATGSLGSLEGTNFE